MASPAGELPERESSILKRILLTCSRGPTRLFRQNVGSGWVGPSQRFTRAETVLVQAGDVLVRQAKPLQAGLCVGSSDLVGWTSVEVTADMVGQRLAVFSAVEVKAVRGVLRPEQATFIARVSEAGGLAGVARSPEDAEGVLTVRRP